MIRKIKALGPGLLFAGAAIGVSHLVYATRAGADFGFGLLWAIILVHIFKYPFFQYGPRYAAATGESLLEGYRKLNKNVLVAYFILNLATMFTIQAAVTIVTAGLAINLFGLSSSPTVWSAVITIIGVAILLLGRYKLLDNLMKVIICILTLTTIFAVIVACTKGNHLTNWLQIFPKETIEISFFIAFLGWMPAPFDISIWHSLWAVEKRKGLSDFDCNKSITDFNIGYFGTMFLGICFLSLGALVMYNSGEEFSTKGGVFSQQLIQLYTSTIGDWSYFIIAIAAFTTMFSTTLTTLDASPRAMSKTSELLIGFNIKKGYWIWIGFLGIGTIAMLTWLSSEMGFLIKLATILSFLTAPFYAIINFILIKSRHIPKEFHPSKAVTILSYFGIAFLIGFSVWYLMNL
ncbi:divalent metal cation transporter [Urechidicola sp. KH5]